MFQRNEGFLNNHPSLDAAYVASCCTPVMDWLCYGRKRACTMIHMGIIYHITIYHPQIVGELIALKKWKRISKIRHFTIQKQGFASNASEYHRHTHTKHRIVPPKQKWMNMHHLATKNEAHGPPFV